MEGFLRPETLFNSEKFPAYRQEHMIVRKAAIGGTGSMTVFPEERAKYEAEAKIEYERKKTEVMAGLGVTTDEGWYNLILKGEAPIFEEFLKIFLKKKRESGEWTLETEEPK